MTVYLLDEIVLRELHPRGNIQVRRWFATVDDVNLRISAMTFFEKRRGWERRRRTDPDLAIKMLAAVDALEAAYGGRINPIDAPSSLNGRACSARKTRASATARWLRQRESTVSSS